LGPTCGRSAYSKPARSGAVESYVLAFEKQEMTPEILQDEDNDLDQAMLKELDVETVGHRAMILGAHKKLVRSVP
jgi:hypothetical protein